MSVSQVNARVRNSIHVHELNAPSLTLLYRLKSYDRTYAAPLVYLRSLSVECSCTIYNTPNLWTPIC